jgi:hypothetical protein
MTAMQNTATHTIVGKMSNGKKIISTKVVVSGTATGAATITVDPLKKIESWALSVRDPGTTPTTFVAAIGTALKNTVTITPTADATGAVLSILSIGL